MLRCTRPMIVQRWKVCTIVHESTARNFTYECCYVCLFTLPGGVL